ncbi:MAG: hypothetical protein OQK12_04395 [Motiliproteus sp.]|nr:hypothetical protein [Motiliproteus sp.]MCW9053283.1 hypothetical protein [Motiliproteus sp.]
MSNSLTFRVRFRFRLLKQISIQNTEYKFEIDSHEVVLSPQSPDVNISDSDWLVMNARGFSSHDEAVEFAEKLKMVCEISSVCSRLGVDTGIDIATSGFGKIVKDRVKKEHGIDLRSNVHGVDVFEDDENIRIAHFSATGTVRASSDPFLGDFSSLFNAVRDVSQETKDTILLLNYALMRPDPIAQIVFSISAVEMLGQNESWSSNQKDLIKLIASSCKEQDIGTETEREEVAEAIKKGLFKLSLRQGVLRLLNSLGIL